jgi:hypothetical protein
LIACRWAPSRITSRASHASRLPSARDDRLFQAAFQRRVARARLGIEAHEIDGGHLVALSRSRELAERLETLG